MYNALDLTKLAPVTIFNFLFHRPKACRRGTSLVRIKFMSTARF